MYMRKCTVFTCICIYMYSMHAHMFGYMCVHVWGRPEADAGSSFADLYLFLEAELAYRASLTSYLAQAISSNQQNYKLVPGSHGIYTGASTLNSHLHAYIARASHMEPSLPSGSSFVDFYL